ncbi:hypothetical protein [Azospirillum sp.]|uniref:hypothetical protein n=1 Tax=Azospirillum sp. TaxID=34012 RepID=UPI003D716C5A
MKIGYLFCSKAAVDENLLILIEAACDRILHDCMDHDRNTFSDLRPASSRGAPLVIQSTRQTADNIHELDVLLRDARAKADVLIATDGYTAQTIVQALMLLPNFSSTDHWLDGASKIGLGPLPDANRKAAPGSGGQKLSQPVSQAEVLRRLDGGKTVNAITKGPWRSLEHRQHPPQASSGCLRSPGITPTDDSGCDRNAASACGLPQSP